MSTGTGIIFWLMGQDGIPAILVGKETAYVSDLIVDNKTKKETEIGIKFGVKINELETTNSTVKTEDDAKTYFRRGARELEGLLGIGEIRYDTPIQIDTNKWKVNYRYLPKNFKRGILKGGIEGSEDPKQTILREISEELGFKIGSKESEQMIYLGQCLVKKENYTIFSLEINNTIWRTIKEKIDDRKLKKSGELFDLDFKKISYIESPDIIDQLNYATFCSIQLFNQKFGNLSSMTKAHGILPNKKRKTKKAKGNKGKKKNGKGKKGKTRKAKQKREK